MKYAVAWLRLGSSKNDVFEVYDSKAKVPYPSHLRSNVRSCYCPIVFISCTPEDQRLWNARLIIWTD